MKNTLHHNNKSISQFVHWIINELRLYLYVYFLKQEYRLKNKEYAQLV